MSMYLLWERGLAGTVPSIIQNRGDPPKLSDREQRHKVGEPIEIPKDKESWTLKQLAEVYVQPANPEEE